MDPRDDNFIRIDRVTYAFIDQGVIMLKAVDGTDPVELTEGDALRLAQWLEAQATRLREE